MIEGGMMYFYNLIKEIVGDKKTIMYVDMDGVIAAYDFGRPLEFDKKRPLYTNIKKLEEVSKLDNIELRILSACRTESQIDEKNEWLDKYAPFFTKDKRHILARENYNFMESSEMKAMYLEKLNDQEQVIVLDDDNTVLKTIHKKLEHIICIQDSEMID